ncbi:MAG TPA: hypothetical protein DHW34_02750 [Actinobacteria bacterium]|nr:hypothetical protein [Actinomycetota bacterium]
MSVAHPHRRTVLAIVGVVIGIVLVALVVPWLVIHRGPPRITAAQLDAQSVGQDGSSVLLAQLRADPHHSGAWIDDRGVLQVRLTTGASTRRDEVLLKGVVSHVVADRAHTYTALVAAQRKVDNARFMLANGIASLGIDEQTGLVEVLALPPRVNDARAAVERVLGIGWSFTAPGHMPTTANGVDRRKEVQPIWGGASIALATSGTAARTKICTTGFSMRTVATPHQYLQVTAGHCTEAWEGRWTGTTWSASGPFLNTALAFSAAKSGYSYAVGSNRSMGDSLCPSTQPSRRLWTCGPGTAEYRRVGGYAGDIAALSVRSAQPYLWVSSTQRRAVYYAQSLPSISGDSSLCASGQTTSTYCGLWVTEPNASALYCDNNACLANPSWNNVHLLRGLTRATKASGTCSHHGDSGGAVYRPATGPRGQQGGVRAVGIISGISTDAHCTVYFTPIGTAERLFAARVVVAR